MTTKHFIITSILLVLTLNIFANEVNISLVVNDDTEDIFTSKDKDFLQQWHYDQVLKMDLSEDEHDEYLSMLNNYTYKMSKLGLSKYQYTSVERKHKFDELADKLDMLMKHILSPSNYAIHQESFDQIENIVYEKRNWEE